MPQGSYNVSRLLQELGLKNVLEMPVRPDIQPTMPLQAMAGQVPVHVAGSAIAGGKAVAVPAEFSAFEIQVLDPGGCVFHWMRQIGASNIMAVQLQAASLVWTTGPTSLPPLQLNSSPMLSAVRMGAIGAGLGLTFPEASSEWPNSVYAPMLIPPGQRLSFVAGSLNTDLRVTFALQGIAASEFEPS